MYNSLVERCFKDCIESFRRKDLDSTEEKVCLLALCNTAEAVQLTGAVSQCVSKCCEKFMKHSARTGLRFAELSQQAEQQMR